MPAPTIGIDVGGTKIAGGVVDESGRIVARVEVPTQPADTAAIIGGITKVGRELRAAAPAAAAVGVGAAALVGSGGVIVGAPNLTWRNLHLRAMLADRLQLPTVVDNDVNAAALAEYLYGAGRGCRLMVMLALGTGIGGGVVVDGRLERGAHGLGAELGHMVIHDEGPSCACGGRGCLEALASGTAMGRMARERAGDAGAAAVLAAAGGDPARITGEIVGIAAVEGDPFARAIVAEAGRFLGVGLANLVNIFDPDRIVVGGGAGVGTGDLLLSAARGAMTAHTVEAGARPPVEIVLAALGEDAGVVGAAALARDAVPV